LRRLTTLFAVLVALAAMVALPSSAHRGKDFPKTIALPTGFQPEGIAIHGKTFYVGSIPTGAVFSGDVRTGSGSVLVQPVAGRSSIGVEFDRRNDRLFVAGGGTGKGFVYDADDGSLIKEYQLTTLTPRFINDVVVTRRGAFFTDSNNKQLIRVSIGKDGTLGDTAEAIPLTGDLVMQPGNNANGIDATPNGKWLVIVQTNVGKLFRVNPHTGVTREIDLGGGNVVNGDGILLEGRTLYVVQNRSNQIAVVKLSHRLRKGKIKRLITDPLFDVPTTIDDVGDLLYAVNARFGTTGPTPPSAAAYNLVQVEKHPGHGHGKHK
jgi:sugar lactone lactonase YvrE